LKQKVKGRNQIKKITDIIKNKSDNKLISSLQREIYENKFKPIQQPVQPIIAPVQQSNPLPQNPAVNQLPIAPATQPIVQPIQPINIPNSNLVKSQINKNTQINNEVQQLNNKILQLENDLKTAQQNTPKDKKTITDLQNQLKDEQLKFLVLVDKNTVIEAENKKLLGELQTALSQVDEKTKDFEKNKKLLEEEIKKKQSKINFYDEEIKKLEKQKNNELLEKSREIEKEKK